MEQVELVPFSKVIATLLLYKKNINPFDIVNFISKISQGDGDVIYSVEDDDLDYLSICVDNINTGEFRIMAGMNYGTILYDNITVRDFLLKNSISDGIINKKVKEFVYGDVGNIGNGEVKVFSSCVSKKRVKVI